MNFLYIPWDFALILVFLGVVVPWRGAARMKRLLSKPELTTSDRLSLYAIHDFLPVADRGDRGLAMRGRDVGPDELGLAAGDPWQVAWTSVALDWTALCKPGGGFT